MDKQERIDHHEEQQLDRVTLLERAHLTAREQRLLEITAQLAVEEALARSDR